MTDDDINRLLWEQFLNEIKEEIGEIEIRSPETGVTKQGIFVDKSIVDFIEAVNDCSWLRTITSCSGLRADHHGSAKNYPYVGFLPKNSDREDWIESEDKGPFTPELISPDDMKLYNAIARAGWIPEFDHAYFTSTILAYQFPDITVYHILGKDGFKRFLNKKLTDDEKMLIEIIDQTNEAYQRIPDKYKINKWNDLLESLVETFCPEKRKK